MNRDLKFLHAFNSIPGVTPATLRALKNIFGTFENAWIADDTALTHPSLNEKAISAMVRKRASIHPDRAMEKLVREQIWILHEEDPHYPTLLKEIHHGPSILYGKGSLPETNQLLAVVGSRKPTLYGIEATETIIRTLAEHGITIVSGLALGIDSAAHRTTLDAGGKTVAILGSGIDRNSIYPREHTMLAERIIESGGAIISEYAPGTPAFQEHFPQRNRIISGMSLGTLVIEAKEKSGALITARFALEQNREVFALPGPIFSPSSCGTNLLIQEGAKLVQSAEDVLEELGIEYTKETANAMHYSELEPEEKLILACLEEPLNIDAIKLKTGLDTGIIISSLSLLEMKGLIKNYEADTYRKIISNS